ncbi:TetR/AcrR family transcriptional regulator C-terminal domain-containing protein [Streptomyces sp. NPDC048484]|uniref:TetR/AcrR family transcriptional regulator n=1 Tax=Streptomyces sp. NPDC048484 TaxID=3155146 RepID=UPI0034128905
MAAEKVGAGNGNRLGVELLWGEQERPSRGPKRGLSIEGIVGAAVKIADGEGLGAVSMQRVATEFGFTTMSLYRYVPGKTQLISLMTDAALATPPVLGEMPGGWRPRMEEWARQFWMVFHRHPWLLDVNTHDRLTGPNEMGWLESAVRALSDTGLNGSEQVDAVLVVNGHVRNWAQYSVDMERGEKDVTGEQWGSAVGMLVEKHSDRYPALMEAMAAGAFSVAEGQGQEFGLRCVLDGIGVLIDERVSTADSAGE